MPPSPIFVVFRVVVDPGSGSIGFGTQFYAKRTYRELRSSRERLIQTDVHVKIRDETDQKIIGGGNRFSKREFTPLDPSRKMRSEILLLLAC